MAHLKFTYKKRPAVDKVCKCGKDATDGYTVWIEPQFSHIKPKPVRFCTECYEYYLRQDWSRYKGMRSSSTKGYHV
jgi:hypothetical protein